MRRLVLLLALAPRLAFAAPPAPAQTDARALVDSVVAAYGGRAALDRVHAYRLEGEVFSAMRHEPAPVTRVFSRPDRFKVLIDYADTPEARLLDHGHGWRNARGGTLEPASGPMLSAMTLQAARADVPWILDERAAACRIVPGMERDSVQLVGLELELGGGLVFRAFVHPRTHRVLVSEGAIEQGEMRTHFETVYSEFRDVDGIPFAFHEENWASGQQTGVTEVKTIVLNPKLADDAFQPPAPAAGTPQPR